MRHEVFSPEMATLHVPKKSLPEYKLGQEINKKGTVIKIGTRSNETGKVIINTCLSRSKINCKDCPYPPQFCDVPKKS
jgi:hypothetical protein